MGRYSLSPNLYDEVRTIDISDLNKWGYLKPDQILSGVLSWRHFDIKNSINIIVNTRSGIPYLELAYILSGENIQYRINLVTIPSNLGRGEVYYFLCPFTKKRCRKLYFTGKYFLHREAAKGLYRIQTLSANQRGMAIYIQTIMHGDDSIDNISKKHYKKYYAGKPTRRYRKDRKRIYKASFF